MTETILTAANRVIRFVRIDNERHGGLISRETTEAIEILAKMVLLDEKENEKKQ